MKLPSAPLAQLEALTSPLLHTSFLGIDIGTSAVKIVQLSLFDGAVTLDTYGEIELAPYGEREPGKVVHVSTDKKSAALMDLLHQVGATARVGGISIPLSSALISFVKMPERDPEQMRRIVPIEAKLYVPLPIEQVVLDWTVVSGQTPKEDAFSQAQSKRPVQAGLEDVMLVAIEKTTAQEYEKVMSEAGLAARFYEVELFSTIRSWNTAAMAPTLGIDIGALTSKIFAVNSRGLPVAVHPVAVGCQTIMESVMRENGWDFSKAQDAVRSVGLAKPTAYSDTENAAIASSASGVVSQVWSEAWRIIQEAANDHEVDIRQIMLSGGGACLPGIKDAARDYFGKEVHIASPFSSIRKPILLEDVLLEVGPRYAVAAGLALRGLGAKHLSLGS